MRVNKRLCMRNSNNKQANLIRMNLISCLLVIMIACSSEDPMPANWELNERVSKIIYYTENYPPFNYEEHGLLFGVSVDILDELFLSMNVGLSRNNVQITDWSTAYQNTLSAQNTMLFSTVRNSSREGLFKWVGPIAPHKEVIIALKGSDVTIASGSDLINYKIGVIKDYSSIQALLDFGVSYNSLIITQNPEELYNQLQDGRVDCIAYSEIGHNLVLSGWQLIPGDFKTAFVLKVSELYYAFNIQTGNDIISYFQNALDNLKNNKNADGSSKYEKIISNYNIINHSSDGITNAQVINLVNLTSDNISLNAQETFAKINNAEAPYVDAEIPALYSFVYDTALTMIAHATNSLLVGNNFKGKPDVSGKLFRDKILAGALSNGTGWEDYIYTKPGEGGLYYKTTYYKLTAGSDGVLYIVCAGKYK